MKKVNSIAIGNYKIKKNIHRLLSTAIFTKNSIYKYFYVRNVKKKIKNMIEKPISVIIENTNYCNISCVFCAHKEMKRAKGIMEQDLFQKIIDQCAQIGVEVVVVQGYGEPLLDKDYIRKIEYAKIAGIKNVYCVTNGILLTPEKSELLVKAGLDFIGVSIDAASPYTYGKIHKKNNNEGAGDYFESIFDNLAELRRIRCRLGRVNPRIQVRFKDFEKNEGELKKFYKKFSKVADDINIYMNVTNWPGSNIQNNLPRNITYLRFPCINLWSQVYITYDGRCALCCQDYECQIEIGNLHKENLMDIWNNGRIADIRKLHLKDEYDKISVCKECVINTHLVSPWWV